MEDPYDHDGFRRSLHLGRVNTTPSEEGNTTRPSRSSRQSGHQTSRLVGPARDRDHSQPMSARLPTRRSRASSRASGESSSRQQRGKAVQVEEISDDDSNVSGQAPSSLHYQYHDLPSLIRAADQYMAPYDHQPVQHLDLNQEAEDDYYEGHVQGAEGSHYHFDHSAGQDQFPTLAYSASPMYIPQQQQQADDYSHGTSYHPHQGAFTGVEAVAPQPATNWHGQYHPSSWEEAQYDTSDIPQGVPHRQRSHRRERLQRQKQQQREALAAYSDAMHAMNLGRSTPQESVPPPVVDVPRVQNFFADDSVSIIPEPPFHRIPPPGEYLLQVDDQVHIYPEDQLVYLMLTEDQRLLIKTQIARIRPQVMRSIVATLSIRLDPTLARDLLSYDIDRIDRAAETLFPEHKKRMGLHERVTWMTGLNNAQRREVIRRVAEVMHQGSDTLRDHLFKVNMEPAVAQQILQAVSREQIWDIATYNNLTPPSLLISTEFPWQRSLSHVQKRALYQRARSAGISNEQSFYNLMAKDRVPRNYGFVMLKVSDEDFKMIIQTIRTPGAPLPEFAED
ncbi:hypothetical protein CBS101457_000190 [Exobasidium rhododendri]|nr:hypothetical protein CBS101457_000190 [Exobasidium rhododendri]